MSKQDEIRLITRGDDLGSFSSANRAIDEAYRCGILRNASVMVCCDHFEEAAEMFGPEKGICLGLHAMITSEWENVRWKPVLPPERVPHLVNSDGTFRRGTKEIHGTGFDPQEIIAELQAQLDLAREKGMNIQYLDDHMAFYWIHPDPDDDSKRMEEHLDAWAEKEGLVHVCHADRKSAFSPEIGPSDCAEAVIRHFQALEKGNTYFCVTHPGYDDEEMRAVCSSGHPAGLVAGQRDWDRQVFTHPDIVAYVDTSPIRPIRYTELGE